MSIKSTKNVNIQLGQKLISFYSCISLGRFDVKYDWSSNRKVSKAKKDYNRQFETRYNHRQKELMNSRSQGMKIFDNEYLRLIQYKERLFPDMYEFCSIRLQS